MSSTADKLKIGVVGAGKMGELHLKKIKERNDLELLGFYEPNKERADEISQLFSIPSISDLKSFFFELDAVVIASSTSSHLNLVKMALESGLHVLVEKPLTTEVNRSVELVELAKNKALVLQVGYVERFRTQEFRQKLKINSPFVIDCTRHFDKMGRELDLDVVFDLMIHDLDLVSQVVQEECEEISGWGIISTRGVIDSAWATLSFSRGNKAHFSASRVALKPHREFKIFTVDQTLGIDLSVNAQAGDPLKSQLEAFVTKIRSSLETQGDFEGLRSLRWAKTIVDQIQSKSKEINQTRKSTDLWI